MKAVLPLIIALIASTTSLSLKAERSFGTGADKTSVVKVAEILDSPEKFLSSTVTISGVIDKVCKKKGCWMTLRSSENAPSFRVKVRDGDMVFPISAIGKTAFATGKIQEKSMTLEQTRQHLAHYAEEQQESFNPNEVTKPMTLYQLVPTGVTILD